MKPAKTLGVFFADKMMQNIITFLKIWPEPKKNLSSWCAVKSVYTFDE